MVFLTCGILRTCYTRVFSLTPPKSQKLPSLKNNFPRTLDLIYDHEIVFALLETAFRKYLLNSISCKFESSVVSCQRSTLTHVRVDTIVIYLKVNRA